MARVIKNNLGNFGIIFLIFILISGWFFSGWPQIWQNPRIPPKIQEAYALTATKTWVFDSNEDGWTFTRPAGGNNTTGSWQSADGNPANGSLQLQITGKNKSDTDRRWDISGTWESLFGIPAGSTVTEVGSGTGNSYNWRVSEYNVGAAGTVGPFTFRDSSETLRGTFSAGTAFSATSAWAEKTGSAISVPSDLQASNSSVLFRISNDLATGNNTNAAVTVRHDTVTLTITYTSVTISITRTTDGVITYGSVDLSGSTSTLPAAINDVETFQNDGTAAEQFSIKTSNAVGGTAWTVGTSAGSDIFVHSFTTSTTPTWQILDVADTYEVASSSVAVSGTLDFYMKIDAPTASADYQQKTITITVFAEQAP